MRDEITVKQAAEILGLTKSGFRSPSITSRLTVRTSKEGWRIFSRAQVEDLARERRSAAPEKGGRPTKKVMLTREREVALPMSMTAGGAADYSTPQAHAVFKCLDRGLDLVQCSIECEIHPKVVRLIATDYAELKDTLIIRAETARELAKLPVEGTIPFRSDTDFLEAVRCALVSDACESCTKRKRALCKQCAERQVPARKSA